MFARNYGFWRIKSGFGGGSTASVSVLSAALVIFGLASVWADSESSEDGRPSASKTTKRGDSEPPAADASKGASKTSKATAESTKVARKSPVDRVAIADKERTTRVALKPVVSTAAKVSSTAHAEPESPIARARREIAECQARYEGVTDYTCTFYKQERINGRLTPQHIMAMKVRSKPQSIYLKFRQPAQGREAIYVAGKNGGRILAHDVGLGKLLAGTLELEPTSTRAMEDCRHPITEAGIGPLLETVAKRWSEELKPEESKIRFRDDVRIGTTHCLMIESVHPERRREFLHHKVRVFIDQEVGLPVRFEAYDWPKKPGAEPLLTEQYSYTELKLNVGLADSDFDADNAAYSFGRF
jgi:hypothetical protein